MSTIIMNARATRDETVEAEARNRQGNLTKPPGSLGRLEALAIQLAGLQGQSRPSSRPAAAVLFAADHPVTAHGVSPYPSSITAGMVTNFLAGGAAASVMAQTLDLPLTVVDVGVDHPYTVPENAIARYVRDPVADASAGDLISQDALSNETMNAALAAGARAIDQLPPNVRVVMLGEMGIGNTTPASAIAAALLGGPPEDWVGPGTGAAGDVLETKRRIVREAVSRASTHDPETVLRSLGGREIAALVGAAARAVATQRAVLVDGFIVTAAMLVLCRWQPAARSALIFAHRSAEPAHRRLLEALDAAPLLDLGLRLGEGTGALAAFPLLDLACATHGRMATFEEAL